MFLEYASSDTRYFLAVVITVIVSITLHELAHGVVAVWLGDRTPIETGHMTPNPAVHMGMVSIVCLLVTGIAWGLMPINPSRLRGRYGSALVAAAGPVSNFVLAGLALTALGLWERLGGTRESELSEQMQNLRYLLWVFGVTNVELALFNLLPVPPLDGSRVLANVFPPFAYLMRRLAAGGAVSLAFIAAFLFAGKVVGPIAGEMATFVVRRTAGW